MTNKHPASDLIILVPDRQMHATLEGLLTRTKSIGIRSINYRVVQHPRHDPGCRSESEIFLRPFADKFRFALVVFDFEGCGREKESVREIRVKVQESLEKNGWKDRCDVVVIEPELEAWIWSQSKQVDEILGWGNRIPALRDWLAENFTVLENGKPSRPKEVLLQALKNSSTPISSALYRLLAEKVSWKDCRDESFNQLITTLQNWFPSK